MEFGNLQYGYIIIMVIIFIILSVSSDKKVQLITFAVVLASALWWSDSQGKSVAPSQNAFGGLAL